MRRPVSGPSVDTWCPSPPRAAGRLGGVASRRDSDKDSAAAPATRRVPLSLVPSVPLDPARPPRLDSLTGLRWWAAFGVFLHHMTNLAPLPVHAALSLGNYGVMFFFVLSGFVLTWSAQAISTSTFYWRRFARIYPAHLVALAVAIPVFYSLTPAAEDWWVKPLDLGVLLLSVLLVQGWWREPTILFSGNPAAWTLTCEAFFYALHPYLSRVLRLLSTRRAVGAAVALIGLSFAWRFVELIGPGLLPGALPWPIARLGEFLLGMCLAHAMRTGWRPRLPAGATMIASLLLLAVIAVTVSTPWLAPVEPVIRPFINEWMLVTCAALITAVAARDLHGGRSLLRHPVLVRLGEASYAFYLVHATIIYAVLSVVGRQLGPIALVWYPLMLAACIVAAFALHLLVEKPMERRLRRWGDARDERRRTARRSTGEEPDRSRELV